LRDELEGVRDELTTSLTSSFDELRRDIVAERDLAETRSAVHETELVNALHRIADAFESIAASLEIDRRDRREQLDAVEFLLREMVLGFAPPTAANPSVLGGSIDPDALGAGGRPARSRRRRHRPHPSPDRRRHTVEVRSRFHDRWSSVSRSPNTWSDLTGAATGCGALRTQPAPPALRRRRRTPATLPSDLPLPAPADDPTHSMWR